MQTLFSYEMHGGDPKELLQYVIAQYPTGENIIPFATESLDGVMKHYDDIITKIKEFAVEWPIEKIAPCDRAILELGVFEMLYSKEVPPIVAINEAIEVAKEYADLNAPKFINGVLSKILEKYCTHRDHKTGELL
jgi:N utilization substance protein B